MPYLEWELKTDLVLKYHEGIYFSDQNALPWFCFLKISLNSTVCTSIHLVLIVAKFFVSKRQQLFQFNDKKPDMEISQPFGFGKTSDLQQVLIRQVLFRFDFYLFIKITHLLFHLTPDRQEKYFINHINLLQWKN